MPVDSKHPLYKANIGIWQKVRTVAEGEEAVKAAGDAFLPRIGDTKDPEHESDYRAYRDRAMFYNATGRTVEGLIGMIFRKDPVVEFDNDRFKEQTTRDGQTLITFARRLTRGVLTVGRHGVLVDTSEDSPAGTPPYLCGYRAEAILNWRAEFVEGRERLIMVVLEEEIEEAGEDEFQIKQEDQMRVLAVSMPFFIGQLQRQVLINAGTKPDDLPPFEEPVFPTPITDQQSGQPSGLIYHQQIWRKVERQKTAGTPAKEEWELRQVIVPMIGGRPLDFIPFVFVGPTETSSRIEKPPVLDIANVNLSHYRNSADLEHGRHFTALPTAWAAGFDVKEGNQLVLGSQVAWVTDEPNASAGFLEFSGAGLGNIENGMKSKEDLMAILGARMLEAPKRAVEAAETQRTRLSGETSITATIAGTVDEAMEAVMRWSALWIGGMSTENVGFTTNKDFSLIQIDPGMLQALMSLLQSSRISYDTFIYNLERGEILPPGRTAEEELELIEENPAVPQGPSMDLGDEDEDEEPEEEEEDEGEEEETGEAEA